MNFIKSAIIAALISLPGLLCTSCNSSNEDEPDTGTNTTFNAFVTLTATSTQGCTFTARKENDDPIVTFSSNQSLGTEIKVGRRYFLVYSNGTADQPFQNGQIRIWNVYDVNQSEIQTKDLDAINKVCSTPVDAATIFRTGNYINVTVEAATGNATLSDFGLIVDEATVNNSYPDVYLAFKPSVGSVGLGQRYTYMGSFDVASLWNRDSCNGFNIHVAGQAQSIPFLKELHQLKPHPGQF